MHNDHLERDMLKQRPTLGITGSNQYLVRVQVDMVISHFIQSARDHISEYYDLHRIGSAVENLEFIHSLLAEIKYCFPVAEPVEGHVHGTNATQILSKIGNEWPVSTLLPRRRNRAVDLHQIVLLGK